MSGFPVRPSRSAFGPRFFQDREPVKNPERQVGARFGALVSWQIAGLGITGGRAVAILAADGTLEAHGEAWDPDQELADPEIDHPSPGVYTIAYPASAPNEDGTQVAIALLGAHVTCQGSTALHATWEIDPNGHEVTVHVWNAAGAAANGGFLLTVF